MTGGMESGIMRRNRIAIMLFLFLLTLVVYSQAVHFVFLNYDDPQYVTHNPQVTSGLNWQSVRWAFTTTHAANWHPLTWLSHMMDVDLYGLQPYGHHLSSIILHAVNGVLLFLLLNRLTDTLWQSAFAAALFLLHPLRVESVAWVAERKDLLSTLFGLLTLLAYFRYVICPSVRRYLLIVALFALSLMAKPMLVTLPFVMLLLDYWPLNRTGATASPGSPHSVTWLLLSVEKLPLIALALASSLMTIIAQHGGSAIASLHNISPLQRIGNAVLSYVRYLASSLYPVDLAVFYPFRSMSPWKTGLAFLFLMTSIAVAISLARRLPWLITGWFWFLGTLVPVIGLIQVGLQAMADRYTYFPMIGIAIITAWGADTLTLRFPFRQLLLTTAASLLLGILSALTWQQLAYWRNSYTLFSHAIRVTDNNFIALGCFGLTLHDQERYADAIRFYRLSLSIHPNQAPISHNLGLALRDVGDYDAAISEFRKAIMIKPNRIDSHYELALLLAARNDRAAARREFAEVLRLQPDHAEARQQLEHYRRGDDHGDN